MKLDTRTIVRHIQHIRRGDVFPEFVVDFNGVAWNATLTCKNTTWSSSGDTPTAAMDKVLLLYGMDTIIGTSKQTLWSRLRSAYETVFRS